MLDRCHPIPAARASQQARPPSSGAGVGCAASSWARRRCSPLAAPGAWSILEGRSPRRNGSSSSTPPRSCSSPSTISPKRLRAAPKRAPISPIPAACSTRDPPIAPASSARRRLNSRSPRRRRTEAPCGGSRRRSLSSARRSPGPGVAFRSVMSELESRTRQSGHKEKASRKG